MTDEEMSHDFLNKFQQMVEAQTHQRELMSQIVIELRSLSKALSEISQAIKDYTFTA